MTTLTVYFSLSSTPISILSTISIPTTPTIQTFPMLSPRVRSKPLPLQLPLSNISVPVIGSRSTSFKRNKTFFERFNQTSPSSSSQHVDSLHSSTESQPRLRRRLTFRRSLRQYSTQNRGYVDIDDGLRLVFCSLLASFFEIKYE